MGLVHRLGLPWTEAVAVSRLTGIRTERDGYLNVLWVDLNANHALDAYPADTGYLARIKATYPDSLKFCNETGTSNLCLTAADTLNNRRLTSAKGALFNAQLLGEASRAIRTGRMACTTRSSTGRCCSRR